MCEKGDGDIRRISNEQVCIPHGIVVALKHRMVVVLESAALNRQQFCMENVELATTSHSDFLLQ